MTQYQKYLKSWTSERGITSFLGSDKPAFQQDWKEEKKGLRFGEMESMGGEDINRAGEPFKKPKPKAKVPINVPSSVYPKLIDALILKYDKLVAKASTGKGKKQLKLALEKLNKVGRDKSGNIYLKESSKYFQDKYGEGWAKFHPTAFKDKYWSIEDKIIDLKNKAEELLS
jgi:hypothetical protein